MNKKKVTVTSKDLEKLNLIVGLVPSDRRSIAERITQEITFIYRTLERLRKEIDENESISKNPALKAYTTLIPKYSALFKQLNDLIPTVGVGDGKSELEEFLKV